MIAEKDPWRRTAEFESLSSVQKWLDVKQEAHSRKRRWAFREIVSGDWI